MQFSTLISFTLVATAVALPVDEEATVTLTNIVTKKLSPRTTYVPMAVSFLDNVQNTTGTNSTSPSASATTTVASNSSASNSSGPASNSSGPASNSLGPAAGTDNAAPVVGVAGLSAIVGVAALLL